MSGFISNTPTHSVSSGTNAITFSPGSTLDQLISFFLLEGTGVPVAPTDSSGDVWTLLATNDTGAAAQTIAIAYLLAPSATASRTVTWGTSGISTHGISEWNGITAAGGTPVFNGVAAGATTVTSASYTPSQANEIVISMLALAGAANPDHVSCTSAAFQAIGTLTDFASNPCIGVQQNGSSFNSGEANGAIVVSATPFTTTYTFLTNAAYTCVAGFKYTPGVAPPPPVPPQGPMPRQLYVMP